MYALGVIFSLASAALLYVYRQDPLSAFAYAVVWPLCILSVPYLLCWRYGARLTHAWLQHAERIMLMFLFLNAPGAFYFHTFAPEIQYDRLLHVVGGWMVLPMLVLTALAVTGNPVRTRRLFLRLLFLAVFLQVAWEGFQFSSDRLLGSTMFFDARQDIAQDVAEDIALGTAGVLASVPYALRILKYHRRFLTTEA